MLPPMTEHLALPTPEPEQTALSEAAPALVPAVMPARRFALLSLGSLAIAFLLAGTATFSLLTSSAPHQAANAATASAAAAIAAAPVPDPFEHVQLMAQSAYVFDLKTGHVLFALNADAERPMASLTKIAMTLAVSEVLPPDELITIPYTILTPDGLSSIPKGSVWPVRDVLDFTLIASSNQGADVLATLANDPLHARYPLSPSTGATVWRMNDIARRLGLSSMIFSNDNGLDLSATQAGAYGSARDVGTLVGYAASTSPDIFSATTRNSMTFKNAAGVTATAINTDTALNAIPGIIMGKTGFTDLAGGNLAVVFDAGMGHPIVAVVMGSTQEGRFSDMEQLVTASVAAIAQSR